MASSRSGSGYHLGSDPEELERLGRQGRAIAPATRTLLRAAGIGTGMRVLDLGAGAGDVSFVAAELVGPTGAVVGIDQSQDAITTARARARHHGLDNVSFVVGDIQQPAPGGPFDAITARLVLLYLPDPAKVLRTQAAQLRPGGVVAPIEVDLFSGGPRPATPLATRLLSWQAEASDRAGITHSLGPRLWTLLCEAGLHPLGMLGMQPHFAPGDPDGPALMAGIIRAMLPVIEQTGVATAEEVGVDTLQARLSEELATFEAVFAYPQLISAWGTTQPAERTPLTAER
ncbi:class I SAM-dependent methyltransferase [Streptomyces spongiae]|uniref:Methyltransferase domain-containing protein n=1 Tax=Streptomyces spongiae TaxID=565072 RepID=A0A5N8XAW5_9ACTN|nr:class I SAM-dependent methyltransferase [Streptomyces spongiae]MPY56334.1 methyltransferase domain-containing protein [Streptomyces spongiae]